MEKTNYCRPFMRMENFVPQEYITACTESAQGSADGEYVYGWVLKCESVTYQGYTYGHGHNKCPNDGMFEKQEGGWVDGTFIRAQDQSLAQTFSLEAIDHSLYPNSFLIDKTGNGLSVDDWWVIGDHAFKVQGSKGIVSFPVSARYDVNHS